MMKLDTPGSLKRAFRVSGFEMVVRDVAGHWCRAAVQYTIGPGGEGVVATSTPQTRPNPYERELERAMNIRARVDAAVGHGSMIDFSALRERAKATGATLPLGLDESEPIDWSTGFDDTWDDHVPRSRKL